MATDESTNVHISGPGGARFGVTLAAFKRVYKDSGFVIDSYDDGRDFGPAAKPAPDEDAPAEAPHKTKAAK